MRLSDHRIIARNVRYAPARQDNGEIVNKIASGEFNFGESVKSITGPAEGGTIAYYKERYAKAPDNKPTAYSRTGNSNSVWGNSSSQNSRRYETYDIIQCRTEIDRLMSRAKTAVSYYASANHEEKGYHKNKKVYEYLQKEIISDAEKAITRYTNKVPDDMLFELKDISNALRNHNLGFGIMRHMPVSR